MKPQYRFCLARINRLTEEIDYFMEFNWNDKRGVFVKNITHALLYENELAIKKDKEFLEKYLDETKEQLKWGIVIINIRLESD